MSVRFKGLHRCGLPLQRALSHSGIQDAAAAASPLLTNQHMQSSLSSTSSAASFNHSANSLEYTTCRCCLVTTKSDIGAGISQNPDAHSYSTSCLLFQKLLFLWFSHVTFFFLADFLAVVGPLGYIRSIAVQEIHLNESMKVQASIYFFSFFSLSSSVFSCFTFNFHFRLGDFFKKILLSENLVLLAIYFRNLFLKNGWSTRSVTVSISTNSRRQSP